jgi:hypothetical protein
MIARLLSSFDGFIIPSERASLLYILVIFPASADEFHRRQADGLLHIAYHVRLIVITLNPKNVALFSVGGSESHQRPLKADDAQHDFRCLAP